MAFRRFQLDRPNPSAKGWYWGIGKITLDLVAELVEPEIRPDRIELFFALHNRSFDRLFDLIPFIDEFLVFRLKPRSDKHDRLLLKQRIAFLRPAELLQKRIDLSQIPAKRKYGYELLIDRLDERSVRRVFPPAVRSFPPSRFRFEDPDTPT